MSEQPVSGDAIAAALAQIEAGVQALRTAAVDGGLSSLSTLGLTETLVDGEVLVRRLTSGLRGVLGEADRRGIAGELCAASTADVLRQLLNLSPGEAGVRVRQARDWTPRVTVTGEPLAPVFAHVAAALDAGQITVAAAKVISKTRADLPAEVDRRFGDAAEALLVEQALVLNPKDLTIAAQRLTQTLNPDGVLNDETDQQRRRDFHLIVNPDGSSTPAGRFTPELTVLIRPILDSLSAPQPAGEDLPDTRSPGQRRHDAIGDFATLALRSGSLPDSGGVPVTITVTVTADDLDRAQHGERVIVEDSYGTPISLDALAGISAELQIGTVTLSTTGGILDYGRSRRLASCPQRRALAARDKGCAFVGCTRHATWCEVHHVTPWLQGGVTSLDNMILLCRYHHRHFEHAGWTVRLVDGVPEWTPPAWLDPDQKPRRNTAHDRPRTPVLE